nr:nucleobindin-2 [Onthophagus taurus]
MPSLSIIFLFITFFCGIFAPPVTKNQQKENEPVKDGLEDYMEYHRYLREVVNALESDGEFKKKLEQANEDDIRTGKIAHELQFVAHHVRTQLDEIKRRELDRLKELMQKKKELMDDNEIDEDPIHHHVDHENPHTFEIDDLKKLIKKTTEDLAEADKKRRDEFKQYEMQKEFEKQQKLNETAPDERNKLEKEYKEQEEKHKKHEKLHEPGHKQQLEEVWEEQDQMQQNFDPKTFFLLHDLDGNGLWDETEVKALFIKELDKMYAAGAPEDDMRERAEEMERMREAVFQEVDLNRDGFIDFDEFIAQTKRNDFQEDHGWQGLDERRQFTDEEFEEYIRQHNAASQQVPPGYHPPQVQGYPQGGYQQQNAYQAPHPAQQVPPGAYQVPHPAQQVPPGAYQGPPGGYQQQPPPGGYQQQPPPGGYQVPPGSYQMPQGGQAPHGAYQVPQGGQQPPPGGQASQGGYQVPPGGQPPQGGYQAPHGGQPPQGGYQVPPGGYQVPVGNAPQQAVNQQYNAQKDTPPDIPNPNREGVQQQNNVPQVNVQNDNVPHQDTNSQQQGINPEKNKKHDEPILQPKQGEDQQQQPNKL